MWQWTSNQDQKWNIGHPWQLLFEINSYAPLDASHEAQIITTSEKWKIRLNLNSSFNGKPTPRVLIEENISMKLQKTQSETQENHEYRCLAKIWKLPQDEMAKHKMWMLIGIYFFCKLSGLMTINLQVSALGYAMIPNMNFIFIKNLAFNEENFYFGRRMLRLNIFFPLKQKCTKN